MKSKWMKSLFLQLFACAISQESVHPKQIIVLLKFDKKANYPLTCFSNSTGFVLAAAFFSAPSNPLVGSFVKALCALPHFYIPQSNEYLLVVLLPLLIWVFGLGLVDRGRGLVGEERLVVDVVLLVAAEALNPLSS